MSAQLWHEKIPYETFGKFPRAIHLTYQGNSEHSRWSFLEKGNGEDQVRTRLSCTDETSSKIIQMGEDWTIFFVVALDAGIHYFPCN